MVVLHPVPSHLRPMGQPLRGCVGCWQGLHPHGSGALSSTQKKHLTTLCRNHHAQRWLSLVVLQGVKALPCKYYTLLIMSLIRLLKRMGQTKCFKYMQEGYTGQGLSLETLC